MKQAYKTKFNENGKVERHKARLVAKGVSQQPSVYCGESFAPIARLDIARVALEITTQNHWHVYQMYVKLVFLNNILKEEVYVN